MSHRDTVDIFPKGNTMATMADSKASRTTYKTRRGARLVLDEGKTVAPRRAIWG